MENKTIDFCPECRKNVEYTTEILQLQHVFKGISYSYIGKRAICPGCKKEIFVPEINDYNVSSLKAAYKQKSLISQEKLCQIPKKYNIGKRPLSKLLGWGEQTLSRYIEGDTPTKQYSDILQKIYDEPEYYLDLVEKNKHILTMAAYNKTLYATENLLGRSQIKSSKSKINLVILYLLKECGDITPLTLQKALYYIQGFYFAFFKEFLFSEDCEAWVHGPVYRQIYHKYKNYHFDPIQKIENYGNFDFTINEKMIIDSIIKYFCCYSGKILEKFTHAELPWLKTRGDLPFDSGCDRIIPKEEIGNYFNSVKEKYQMLSPADIKSYSLHLWYQI